MSGRVLTPTLLPPNPANFRAKNETERIGLLIRRVIPQARGSIYLNEESALAQLRSEIRGSGKENRGSELEFGNNEPASKRKRDSKGDGDVDPAHFSLFGGAISIAPLYNEASSTNKSTMKHTNDGPVERVVSLSSGADSGGGIWGPPPPASSSSSTSSTAVKQKDVLAKKVQVPAKPSSTTSRKPAGGLSVCVGAGRKEAAVSALPTSKKIVESSSGPRGAVLKMDDFRGAEKICRNAGKQRNGLHSLLRITNGDLDSPMTFSLVWCDETSNHEETTTKFCKPSHQCKVWHCACNRYIRVDRAYRPVFGVFIRFPIEEEQGHCYYIPLAASLSDITAPMEGSKSFVLPFTCETTVKDRWGAFYSILCSSRPKVIFNAKLALLPILRNLELHGFDSGRIQNIQDPRVGAYIVSEQDFTSEEPLELYRLCREHSIDKDIADGVSADAGRVAKVIGKTWKELELVSKLYPLIIQKLTQTGALVFFQELEMKVVIEMAKLELQGIRAEPAGFDKIMRSLASTQEQIEKEAATIAGTPFNLASPEQVSEMLYKRLKIPPPANTSAKGRHYSTSEQDLKARAADYPIVQCILDYRACRKVTTTFDWRNFLYDGGSQRAQGGESVEMTSITSSYSNAHNHMVASQLDASPARSPSSSSPSSASRLRIHPRWNLGFTRTGRLSCSSPNLQQVPKEFSVRDLSINIRSLFLPPRSSSSDAEEEFVFVAADYSQIEMRVLACACNEQNLIRLFEDPGVADVYRLMASQIYSKSIADVSSHERSVAKTISLGIIYGMGPDQTAARLSITRAAAVQIIQKFHRLFPAISGWVSGVKERARKNGYVQTMGKFRRYLPDMTSSDTSKRATAERQSVNTIIQGSASEMIKLAMISMSAAIEGEDWDYESQTLSKPVLVATIHDELLYSVNKKLEPKLVRCLRRVMEDEVPRLFRLPLKFCVTVSSGDDWGTLENYVAS